MSSLLLARNLSQGLQGVAEVHLLLHLNVLARMFFVKNRYDEGEIWPRGGEVLTPTLIFTLFL